MDYLLYLLVGAIAGLISGLFGLGGGVVIVPILIFSLAAHGIPADSITHMAVATSLATILFTSVSSIIAHHRRGGVIWPLVAIMSPGIMLGAASGGYLAVHVPGDQLQLWFGVFLCFVAYQMFKPGPLQDASAQLSRRLSAIMGLIIGAVSSVFGIGGGTLTVPFLTGQGVAVNRAVATSSACGFPIALAGAAAYIVAGYQHEVAISGAFGFVYIPAWVGIVATSLPFARVGAGLAHRLDPLWLKRLFAVAALIMGLRFIFINAL